MKRSAEASPARVHRLRFALDQNFPDPLIEHVQSILPDDVRLSPLRAIDPSYATLDDWEIFRALHLRGWDGLVTNDRKLLAQPREMAVFSQTELTLVVAVGEGDSPVRAVGVLLCHLNHICRHSTRRPQIWNLKVTQKNHEEPHVYLEKIAQRENSTVAALLAREGLPAGELQRLGPRRLRK